MEFRLDHSKFESLCTAFEYVLSEHAAKDHPVYPGEEPAFVFRGECGRYSTTRPSIARVTGLSGADRMKLAKISDWVAARVCQEREGSTLPQACDLLQHYGMPSPIVDFTGDLGLAFSFAGGDPDAEFGRLAVLPYVPSETGPILKFFDHPWAERAQRQAAFGVLMDPFKINDLKADSARRSLDIRWYEFAILPQESEYCRKQSKVLLRESNDASAGFVRYFITLYVEEFGKLSSSLTDWLLRHIVIAPYCALVEGIEKGDAVVFFRGSECLQERGLAAFDPALEIERSRRYWSEAYSDDSRERLPSFRVPGPGGLFVDPRTYHPEG